TTVAAITAGITNVRVQSMAVAPSSPATVYAVSTLGKAWRSSDGSRTWTSLPTMIAGTNALVVHPTIPTIVYAATDLGGVRAADRGVTWRFGPGTPASTVALVLERSAPATLYVASSSAGVYRTVDGASTWAAANTGLPQTQLSGLALGAESPGVLYAATYS